MKINLTSACNIQKFLKNSGVEISLDKAQELETWQYKKLLFLTIGSYKGTRRKEQIINVLEKDHIINGEFQHPKYQKETRTIKDFSNLK